jgi:hypothetical protein
METLPYQHATAYASGIGEYVEFNKDRSFSRPLLDQLAALLLPGATVP